MESVPVTATEQNTNDMHYCKIAVQMQVRRALECKWNYGCKETTFHFLAQNGSS
jgi:hypothetical protein